MVEFCVQRITTFIKRESGISDKYLIDRVRYGYEVIISEGIKIIIILCLSNILNCFIQYSLITILLFLLRTRIGGSHCKNFTSCLIKTLVVYLAIYYVTRIGINIPMIIEIITITVTVVLLNLIKYKNKANKSLDDKVIRKIKIVTITQYIFIYIVTLISKENIYIDTIIFCSIFIILEYFFRRGVVIWEERMG